MGFRAVQYLQSAAGVEHVGDVQAACQGVGPDDCAMTQTEMTGRYDRTTDLSKASLRLQVSASRSGVLANMPPAAILCPSM